MLHILINNKFTSTTLIFQQDDAEVYGKFTVSVQNKAMVIIIEDLTSFEIVATVARNFK